MMKTTFGLTRATLHEDRGSCLKASFILCWLETEFHRDQTKADDMTGHVTSKRRTFCAENLRGSDHGRSSLTRALH
jgi:hypothetical protein